jgi:mRNA deadenylase 3'-5' endonuclease subunit Ccr4
VCTPEGNLLLARAVSGLRSCYSAVLGREPDYSNFVGQKFRGTLDYIWVKGLAPLQVRLMTT